ncbi:hypothetical protein [Nocardia wallacei]|uniref:hypothetical protein n=1 Tax=Nocardia wallacei TaxID=480035 RepID=UPI002457948E|nr:hypothetical protein [Nocardia wallacei]
MRNVTIGRYQGDEALRTRVHHDAEGNEIGREQFKAHAGWIEGTRDDGSTWIMFLDGEGGPLVFWGHRDEDGGVIGDGILLA